MKILLATDGSEFSKAAVEELAGRPFSPGTEVHIVSVYKNSPLLMPSSLPMGGLAGYYETDAIARKHAEDAVKDEQKF